MLISDLTPAEEQRHGLGYATLESVAWVRELGGNAVQHHTFETFAEPQAQAIGLLSEYDYPGVGTLRTTGLPWAFSGTPAHDGRPPLLGERTEHVLRAAEFTEDEIAAAGKGA